MNHFKAEAQPLRHQAIDQSEGCIGDKRLRVTYLFFIKIFGQKRKIIQ